jgi:UDP-sugar pyrophosphorylase
MVESHTSQDIERALQILKDSHQDQIIEQFNKRSVDEQNAFAAQVIHLDKVTPGGMQDYVERARRFLENSKNNVNPFDKFKPEVPHGFDLKPGDALYDEMEEIGLGELGKVGFVLIAGGLGERLGYSGIKIDLPVTTIEENYCYLKYYV